MLQINRPLGLGELLDGAFRVYRAHFSRLVLTAAIFLVPVGVLSTLLLGITASSFTELLLAAGSEPTAEFDAGLGSVGAYLLTGLLGYLAVGLAYVSLTSQVVGILHGEELPAGESIRRGARRLPAFIGLAVLVGLAVLGLTLALYILLFFVVFASVMALGAVGAIDGGGSGLGVAAVALAVVVFVFYMAAIFAVFIPVGMLLARWAAAPTLLVAEGLGPVAAMSRSWQLTRNNLWRVFGYLVLLTIFNFVVLGLPMSVLQWLLLFALTTQWYAWLSGLLVGLSYLVSVVWVPFLVLALALLYFDLRVRNESLDLEARVRQLEESTRPGSLPS